MSRAKKQSRPKQSAQPKTEEEVQPPSEPTEQPAQQYDTTLKNWIRGEAKAILPLLLTGVELIVPLTIEVIKPTMRVDKVFKVWYEGRETIFHIEFETGSDPYILSRLSAYNAVLHHEYQLPVISMIIYPFRTTMAKSPYVVTSGERKLTKFHFLTLPLFEQEAEYYIREHLTCMYPVVPTMHGVTEQMITEVMAELAALYRDDEVKSSDQFVWMRLLLDRSTTITEEEKRKIRRHLMQYDPLWEENPRIQEDRARSRAEGELLASRRAVITIVKKRFPTLTELAQQKVAEITKPDVLDYLIEEVVTAPDEQIARWLLRPRAA